MSWEAEIGQAETVAQDVAFYLGERANEQRSGGVSAETESTLKARFKALNAHVDSLRSRLREMETSGVPSSELQRCKDQLRSLTSKRSKLTKQDKAATAATERSHLFKSPASASPTRYTSSAAAPMDAGMHLQVQNEEMRDQDAMLDELNRGVNNLKTIGNAIHDEASLHHRLLDDIESETDRAQAGLTTETKRAEHVSKHSVACWMYIAICLLFLLMIGLIVTMVGG